MLREFALSTKEGLALMVLAEALLRVPDAAHRRPVHRGQARPGRLRASRDQIERLPGQRVRLGARRVGAGDPARRDAAGHHRPTGQAARRAGGARGDAAGDAADGQPLRARRNHRGGAGAGAAAIRAIISAIPSTCSAKARAPLRMRHAISIPMPARSRRSAVPPATGPCPTGPAFPSNCRRCIRASRR